MQEQRNSEQTPTSNAIQNAQSLCYSAELLLEHWMSPDKWLLICPVFLILVHHSFDHFAVCITKLTI